jgi:hypothetical protein
MSSKILVCVTHLYTQRKSNSHYNWKALGNSSYGQRNSNSKQI